MKFDFDFDSVVSEKMSENIDILTDGQQGHWYTIQAHPCTFGSCEL